MGYVAGDPGSPATASILSAGHTPLAKHRNIEIERWRGCTGARSARRVLRQTLPAIGPPRGRLFQPLPGAGI